MNKVFTTALLISVMSLACNQTEQSENAEASNVVQQQDTSAQTTSQGANVSDAQQRLRDRAAQTAQNERQTPEYKLNVEPYSYFLDENGNLDLNGVQDSKLDEILGQAPILVRQAVEGAPLRREVRVYLPYEEDSTGLYIFIRNNIVESFHMDTFLGLANSSLIQDYFTN